MQPYNADAVRSISGGNMRTVKLRRIRRGDASADTDPVESDRSTVRTSSLRPVHLHAIQKLAKEENWPVEDVNRRYTLALQELGTGARIQDYLVLLTCKKVRRAIRQSRMHASPSISTTHA